MQYGRREIYTDVKEITSDNIIQVLRDAVLIHSTNAMDCTELLKIEKGEQAQIKKKLTRTEIDNWVYDNVANEITTFKVNYNWGNPLTFIQRGEVDSGGANEADAISILNEYYDAQNQNTKTQELARFVEICGVGYTLVELNTEWEDGDSPFINNVLDPRFAFVVRSNYYTDKRVMMGVSFRQDRMGNKYYTCYTKDYRYEIINTVKIIENDKEKDVDKWELANRGTGINPIGKIPIIEWIRDYDRMGCFERQIPIINAIGVLISCILDDTEQNTNAIFWGNDIEFQKDEEGNLIKPEDGDWLLTETTQDGKQPFIKPITMDYNYNEILNHITYLTDRAKIEAGVPLLSGNVSNTTGVAESNSAGWANAEADAERQDEIKYGRKTEELKVVLAVCKVNEIAEVDEKIKTLRYVDAKANTSRQKNYEMSIKSATLSNLINVGVYGLHAFKVVNMFPDVNQAWSDSKEMVEAYQQSRLGSEKTEEPQTADGGLEAQIENSPNIDGMKTERVEVADE